MEKTPDLPTALSLPRNNFRSYCKAWKARMKGSVSSNGDSLKRDVGR